MMKNYLPSYGDYLLSLLDFFGCGKGDKISRKKTGKVIAKTVILSPLGPNMWTKLK